MLFYNNINIKYDGISNIKADQFAGYIKNNIKFDNLELHSNAREIENCNDIYKIYNLTYVETHKIDKDLLKKPLTKVEKDRMLVMFLSFLIIIVFTLPLTVRNC